jgi:nicotinamide mononucleotide adenylyltransferase
MTKWNLKENKKMIYHHMSEDPMYYEDDVDTLKEKLLDSLTDGELSSSRIKELFGDISSRKEESKGISLFAGKFQPPHLGHIRTLLKLYDKYDKIYVCVTEGGPHLIPPKESYNILKETLRYLPKYEVITVTGSIYERNAFAYMPKFDIFVSANIKAINIAKEMGYVTEFVSRTQGIGYSGTSLRKLAQLEDII